MAIIHKKVYRENGKPGYSGKDTGKRSWKPMLDKNGKPVPWLDKQGLPRYFAQVYTGRSGDKALISKTFKREKDAKRWARSLENRKDKGDQPATDRRTLADYMASWLDLKETGQANVQAVVAQAPAGTRRHVVQALWGLLWGLATTLTPLCLGRPHV